MVSIKKCNYVRIKDKGPQSIILENGFDEDIDSYFDHFLVIEHVQKINDHSFLVGCRYEGFSERRYYAIGILNLEIQESKIGGSFSIKNWDLSIDRYIPKIDKLEQECEEIKKENNK